MENKEKKAPNPSTQVSASQAFREITVQVQGINEV